MLTQRLWLTKLEHIRYKTFARCNDLNIIYYTLKIAFCGQYGPCDRSALCTSAWQTGIGMGLWFFSE